MKIAIASTFHPYRGGIAQFNDEMAKSLKSIGHDVRCYNWSRQYPSVLFPGKTQIKTGTSRPPSGPDAPMDSISPNSWRKTAIAILEHGDVDMVILPFWHSALAPALRGVAKAIKKQSPLTKVVALMHNATSHDGKASDKWLTKRFLNRVDSCITLSQSVTEDVEILAPNLPIETLFHPLYNHYPKIESRLESLNHLGLPSSAKHTILFFGIIRPYKGLTTLIKAAEDLNSEIHIIIAGECYGSWNQYKRLIKASPAKSRIHVFNEFIPDSELPYIFGASDMVVLPYLNASQSGVTATAVHYNLPIIASDVGDLSSTITPGVTGDLVSPGASKELAKAINGWINTEHKAEDLITAYEAIRNTNSWEAFAEKLV
jgi:glycosyltransferase involved in cell wall biosynthesis